MDAVFRLLEAQQPFGFRVKLNDGQGEKAQGAIRETARRMRSSPAIGHL